MTHWLCRSASLLAICAVVSLVAAQAPATPRIGVVDFNHVFQECEKRAEFQDQLGKLKMGLEERLLALAARVTPLQKDLELLEKGTTRHKEVEKQIYDLLQERNYELKVAERDYKARMLEFHERLYQEIETTVTGYGKQHGYAVILQREFTLPEEALQQSWPIALYVSEEVDLTGTILGIMNR